jgi:hypothetical protein
MQPLAVRSTCSSLLHLSAVALLVLTMAGRAAAAPVTYLVSGDLSGNPFDFLGLNGSSFTISYTIDQEATSPYVYGDSDETRIQYVDPGPGNLSLTLSGTASNDGVYTQQADLIVVNAFGPSPFVAGCTPSVGADCIVLNTAFFFLDGETLLLEYAFINFVDQNVIGGTGGQPPVFSAAEVDLANTVVWFRDDFPGESYIVSNLAVSSIPEPSTGLLTMTGILALAYRQVRRRGFSAAQAMAARIQPPAAGTRT